MKRPKEFDHDHHGRTDTTQIEEYNKLVTERERRPCTPREQAGQWWNDMTDTDDRTGRTREAILLAMHTAKDQGEQG